MLIALLLVLGVDLVVIVAFVASVLRASDGSASRPGFPRRDARRARARSTVSEPTWSRGYGRWVRDVLVWSKAPFLFRTRAAGRRRADGGAHRPSVVRCRRLGDRPAVVRVVSGENTIELAVEGDQIDLLLGPFAGRRRCRPRSNHPTRVRLPPNDRRQGDCRPGSL